MIEQELLLLGLLKESPKHGYEIKKKIQGIVGVFAGLDVKSIYYPLRILEKQGLILKRINRSGRRPERAVYELTAQGDERFQQLLSNSILNFRRPQFSLDLSLYFLHYISPVIARRRLRARTIVLGKLAKELAQMISKLKKEAAPDALVYILEHNLQMVQAESRFLADMVLRI